MDYIARITRNNMKSIFATIPRFAAGVLFGLALMPACGQAQMLFYTDGDHVGLYNFSTTSVNGAFISQVDATGVALDANWNVYVGTSSSAPTFGAGAGVMAFNHSSGAPIGTGAFVPYTEIPANNVNGPQGMRFGPSGNLYIADTTNSDVHVYNSSGTSLGSLTGVTLSQPIDVAFDTGGNLYVTSALGVGVSAGATQPFMDFVSAGDATAIGMFAPSGLAWGPDNKLYVADTEADKIFRFNTDGTFDTTFANLDTLVGGIFQPYYLAITADGQLYVSGLNISVGDGEILGFQNGVYGGPLVVGLNNPRSLAVVPEPATWLLPMVLVLGVVLLRRRKMAAV